MKYLFPSKDVKTKYPIVGHGNQGTVYKIDSDTVLKVYNEYGRRHDRNDDLEVAKRLSTINLKCYVTPFDIREENGLLISYKMKKINFDKRDIKDMTFKEYIESLKDIRSDTEKITALGIQLSDLQRHNIALANGKIKIYDFSDYFLGDRKYLKIHNNNEINDCFGDLCFMDLSKDNPILIYDKIYSPFLSSSKNNIEDYFEETIEDKEMTLNEYVKSLRK